MYANVHMLSINAVVLTELTLEIQLLMHLSTVVAHIHTHTSYKSTDLFMDLIYAMRFTSYP